MSTLEDYEWMLRYLRMLDPTNAKILEGLGKHGPRNILALAKSLSLPPATVSFRIKKLMEVAALRVRANLNYSKLGLMKAVVIAEAKPGRERKLQQAIDHLDYWTYTVRCFGKYDGYCTILAFPARHREELSEYLDKAMQLGALSRYLFYVTTNFAEVAPNFDWFNFQKKSWNFLWDRWIEEVQGAPEELDRKLTEPKSYPIRVDEIDLLILKELEKDGGTKFTELAEIANMTPQGVRYRYQKHAVERGLLTDYEVAILPYPLLVSNYCCFVIDFEHEAKLAKFVNSVQDKPFVFNYAKVVDQPSLVALVYTPKTEFTNLINAMNRLAEKRLAKSFLYVTLDVSTFQRQTISYECFQQSTWIYNREKKLEHLKELMRK
jgi:DNA-binding Lrp family transcriptional regulator